MTTQHELLGLTNPDAEIAVLAAMRLDTNVAIDMAQKLAPTDFSDPRRQVVFEAIFNLLRGVEAIDVPAIHAECVSIVRERKLKYAIDQAYIETLDKGDPRRAAMYGNTVKRLAWLRQAGDFAFWLAQELQTRPDPNELFTAAQERWQVLQPKREQTNFVYGWDTIKAHKDVIRKRAQERAEGMVTRFDWPWFSWNHNGRVRPLRRGMVGILAAPDGQGKTTYLEQIAEHWASRGHHVVYVHLEDAFEYKLDRRLCRRAMVAMEKVEAGDFTPEEQERVDNANEDMALWAEYLHYYHAAGENMATIVRELEARVAEGVCDAVVFDYLDKVQASRGQAKLFGDQTWERQANDMETLKSFAEKSNVPVFTATQGNKSMQEGGTQTRKAIQGSGQKSQKAQLVLILTRDLVGENGLRDRDGKLVAEPGEYSPIAKIRIDKQNIGKTGELQQYLVGKYFTVRDLEGRV